LVAGGFVVRGRPRVDWLRDKIRALDRTIPETRLTDRNGRNSWQCLLRDAEEEKRDYASTLERVHSVAEQNDREIAQGFRPIHEEEKRAEILEKRSTGAPSRECPGVSE